MGHQNVDCNHFSSGRAAGNDEPLLIVYTVRTDLPTVYCNIMGIYLVIETIAAFCKHE